MDVETSISSRSPITKLGPTKYVEWEKAMYGRLGSAGVRRIVLRQETAPAPDPSDSAITMARSQFFIRSDKAAGEIYQWLDEANKIHVDAIRDDPAAMWEKLHEIHSKSAPNSRFNSLSTLFSIRKRDDESLTDLTTRVEGAMLRVKALRPPDTKDSAGTITAKGYTLEKLDEELTIMAMIRALPAEYNSFVSSVLLLSNITKDTILEAFRNEETQRRAAIEEAESAAATAAAHAARVIKCYLCDGEHTMSDCPMYEEARALAKKKSSSGENRSGNSRSRGGRGANRGKKANAAKVEEGCDGPAVKADAAVCRSSTSTDPATDQWNTDTGATASMTPHRKWFGDDFKPWRVPIILADGKVIYSVGKGSVRFRPSGTGKSGGPLRDVIFSDVLFVPSLTNNLLSVFTLLVHRDFIIVGRGRTLSFYHKSMNTLAFTATVNRFNVGYLNGSTLILSPASSSLQAVIPASHRPELASPVTVAVDRNLLHRRMCHLGKERVDQLISKELTADLIVNTRTPVSRFCEACIDGKQHRHPFPHTAERAPEVLGRIFSDVHGPMAVQSHGHRYWVTFIDDCSRWLELYTMAKKSDVFAAFKLFQAVVERQTGRKVKCLHTDHGGEYTLKALLDHCAAEGIRIEWTTPATPQQNGVSERANRTIAEAVTAMLSEAGLPMSFWRYAVRVYRHVHNRCPTSALPNDMTPYEAFKGKKPKIAHLRVFGCRAYVLVGREKRKSLQGHTIKGIFIGYPDNYAGWMVYDPVTKKTHISRDVIFNESEFPGLKTSSTSATDTVPSPANFPELDIEEEPYDSDEPFVPPPLVPAVAANEPLPPAPGVIPGAVGVLPDPAGAVDHELPPVGDAAVHPPLPPPSPRRLRERGGPKFHPNHAYDETVRRQEEHKEQRAQERAQARAQEPPPPPDPAPHVPEPEPLWNIEVGPVDANGEQEVDLVINLASTEALMAAGRAYVEHGIDPGGYGAMFANMAGVGAFKVGAHDANPRSYREAMDSEHSAQWHEAMCEEMNAHEANGTWRVVYLPAGKKAIGSRWVFKVKHLPSGAIDRFKARIVAQGFSQRPGVDFDETFAPTARWNAVRTILAVAAVEDMHLESVDITAAFLHSDIDSEIYMRLPDGFPFTPPPDIIRQKTDGPPVGLLEKGLYGIKQGAYLWHKRLHSVFLSMGFSRIVSDPCVYVYLKDDVRIIIPVHVDDLTIASKSRPAILRTIEQLREHFTLRHLGPTTGLLGVRVTRDRPNCKLWIDQRAYAIEVLSRFGMLNCAPTSTPLAPGAKLSKDQCPISQADKDFMRNVPYIQATGALLYLAMCTRPDIAYPVGVLCRFNMNPGPAHWKAVKHLLRYIRGTLDYRIEYSAAAAALQPSASIFQAFSDADHGGNTDTGRSTTGTLLVLAGGAVSWFARLQSVIALSTTEAEFIAASETGRELCWLRNFLADIGTPQKGPSRMNMDNQSAISVTKHPEHMGRLKHLDRHWFWLRQAVEDGKVAPAFIPTSEMTADLLTKALPRDLVDRFRRHMGLVGEWTRDFDPPK